MDFEEWYLENSEDAAMDVLKGAFEDGQQSKQAEIDAAKEKIDEAIAEISRAINCCESIETECVLIEIKEILK